MNVIVRVTEVNEGPLPFDEDAPTLLSVVENAGPAGHHDWARRPSLFDADTYAVTDQGRQRYRH